MFTLPSYRGPVWASFLIMLGLILTAIFFKMVGACVAGFLIFTLTHKVADRLESQSKGSQHGRPLALAGMVMIITAVVTALSLGLFHFFRSGDQLSTLMARLADVLTRTRSSLPVSLSAYVPVSVDALKDSLVAMLRSHRQGISGMGMEGLHGVGHLVVGLLGGAMVSFAPFKSPADYEPLSEALLLRFSRLREAFDKVVLAQLKISLINTVLTAIYLLVLLPLCGVHVPLATTMVALTFAVGLLPVVGNLISNVTIVVLSLGVSMHVAIASLVFLIVIHKMEYFLNARIIGHNVQAAAWEMLLVMMGMEVVFGIGGLIAAPVLYAYLKSELLSARLVGLRPVPTQPLEGEKPEWP